MMSEANDALPDIRVPGAVGLIGGAVDGGLLAVVAIAASDDAVSVVPLSSGVHDATEWDLGIAADVLGYAVIAEVWNYGTSSAAMLEVVATVTRGPSRRWISWSVALTGGRACRGSRSGRRCSTMRPASAVPGERSRAGACVLGASAGAGRRGDVGELMRHRREELATRGGRAGGDIRERGWLEAVEEDSVDPRQALPPGAGKRAAAVADRRQQRLRAIMRSTLEGHSPQFARVLAPGESPTIDADAYVDAIFDELGKPRT